MGLKETTMILLLIVISLVAIPFDMAIMRAVTSHRIPIINMFMMYYTMYGNYVFALIEGLILLRLKNRRFRNFLYLVLNSYFGWFIADRIVAAIKNIVRRPRPYIQDSSITPIVTAGGFSFPSGHSSAAWALTVPFILTARSRLIKLVLILFAILMSFSRVYCGVHFLSDIIFGGYIGYVVSKSIFENITAKKLSAIGNT